VRLYSLEDHIDDDNENRDEHNTCEEPNSIRHRPRLIDVVAEPDVGRDELPYHGGADGPGHGDLDPREDEGQGRVPDDFPRE